MKKILSVFIATLLLVSLGACALFTPKHPISVFESEEHIADLFQELEHSVVAIESYVIETKVGLGSGTIFKKEAVADSYYYYVVTNHHVVEIATHVMVYLSETKAVRGDIYAVSQKDSNGNFLSSEDVAIVRFESDLNLRVQPIIPFDNPYQSVSVRTGHEAFAIGTPVSLTYYNLLSNVATISKVTRNWIIHGANINPGNSGGPLFSTDGTFIGMNTQRLEKTPSSDRDVVLIGEAIHVNQVAAVLHQLFDSITPKFGINIMNSHETFLDLSETVYGFDPYSVIDPSVEGIVIIDVATTFPAFNNLLVFDVITKVNGTTVTSIRDLSEVLGILQIGSSYTFEVIRKVDGAFIPIEITIVL